MNRTLEVISEDEAAQQQFGKNQAILNKLTKNAQEVQEQ